MHARHNALHEQEEDESGGRPRKGADLRVTFSASVSKAHRRALNKLVNIQRRSLSTIIEILIEKEIAKEGLDMAAFETDDGGTNAG